MHIKHERKGNEHHATNTAKTADFTQNADSQGTYKLSPADEKRLQETLELRKQGKLRYFSLDESLKMSDERLKELGASL